MLLISDLVLNIFHYHQPFFTFDILPRYVALALISGLGFALRGRANVLRLLAASVAGSLLFFVITNTGSWLSDPGYAKTAAGWLQAMTTGLPGYPSTWWFYRYTLFGDLFYTLLFAGCMAATAKTEEQPQPQGAREFAATLISPGVSACTGQTSLILFLGNSGFSPIPVLDQRAFAT